MLQQGYGRRVPSQIQLESEHFQGTRTLPIIYMNINTPVANGNNVLEDQPKLNINEDYYNNNIVVHSSDVVFSDVNREENENENQFQSAVSYKADIRMVENASYPRPSLVTSMTLDPNPAYGTNVAMAPEDLVETVENIAYQYNC